MFGQKNSKLPLNLLKIDNEGYHLSVEATINDKKAFLIIDPGASRTVFDEKQIKRYLSTAKAQNVSRKTIGVGKEQIQAKRIKVDKLEIGSIIIESYHAAAVDLSGINNQYKRLHFKQIQGLLGGDLLNDLKAVINYKNLTLKIG